MLSNSHTRDIFCFLSDFIRFFKADFKILVHFSPNLPYTCAATSALPPALLCRALQCSTAHAGSLHGRHRRGSRGSGPRTFENCGDEGSFFLKRIFFAFSNIFKLKWQKSEEKLNSGHSWVWVPMSPSPQSKLRGDDLGSLD